MNNKATDIFLYGKTVNRILKPLTVKELEIRILVRYAIGNGINLSKAKTEVSEYLEMWRSSVSYSIRTMERKGWVL